MSEEEAVGWWKQKYLFLLTSGCGSNCRPCAVKSQKARFCHSLGPAVRWRTLIWFSLQTELESELVALAVGEAVEEVTATGGNVCCQGVSNGMSYERMERTSPRICCDQPDRSILYYPEQLCSYCITSGSKYFYILGTKTLLHFFCWRFLFQKAKI